MSRELWALGLTIVIGVLGGMSGGIAAQQTIAPTLAPRFEVASVTPFNGQFGPGMGMRALPDGRFISKGIPLKFLIVRAFGVKEFELAEGPALLNDAFDIEARATANASPDDINTMLRTLLIERFKLVVHTETRMRPIHVLTMARPDRRLGPQLHPSSIDCEARRVSGELDKRSPGQTGDGLSRTPPCVPGIAYDVTYSTARIENDALSMRTLASMLEQEIHAPIADRTGLTGAYALSLAFANERPQTGLPATDASSQPTLRTALREQLALTLEVEPGPVQILVIDSIQKPIAN